ncbi:MAG: mismatch repair endonuclease MutL [Pantoea agglomerans]|nr:mismatch repair endonuclease MutL [Pantoea agglomerans]
MLVQRALTLILKRGAQSLSACKIASLDDLEAIMSLGFRGEALASISSVSRLTLTSRTADQTEAWQAYAEGRDMTVTVKPAAHPCGTTLEVLDLFYNTPARRKFMRTEKTEFGHIDEVIRRIALARFDVALSLSHNGKMMRQYRAVSEESQRERRLAAICGTTFIQHALRIDWQHDDLSLRGWVADPAGSRQVTELQYCYVNGRMMRDKLINHAIRQAFQTQLQDDQQPAYVLYLEIDPHQVDVNVHPAKHEVRFHQSRLVHDFIYQGVVSALQAIASPILPALQAEEAAPRWQPENRQAAGGNHFAQPSAPASENQSSASTRQTPPAAAPAWQNKENVYRQREGADQKLMLMALPVAARWLKQAQLEPGEEGLKPQPLLIPVRLKIALDERQAAKEKSSLLNQMGIDLQPEGDHVTLRAVPLPLRTQNLQILIPELLGYLARQQEISATQLAQWLARRQDTESSDWNHSQAINLLAELERLCPQLLKSPPSGLLQPIEIESAINALKHE